MALNVYRKRSVAGLVENERVPANLHAHKICDQWQNTRQSLIINHLIGDKEAFYSFQAKQCVCLFGRQT